MARGQQKIEAQAKNAERQAKLKKQKAGGEKHSDNKNLTFQCPV